MNAQIVIRWSHFSDPSVFQAFIFLNAYFIGSSLPMESLTETDLLNWNQDAIKAYLRILIGCLIGSLATIRCLGATR